jgi:hypothetical protein
VNGSRLGKEYSANALNERYPEVMKNTGANLNRLSDIVQPQKNSTQKNIIRKNKKSDNKLGMN